MKIHHIGYYVKDIDKAVLKFSGEEVGYKQSTNKIFDEKRKAYIIFLEKDNLLIELVAPTEKDSDCGEGIQKRGVGPYHICYESEVFENDIAMLRQNGFLMLGEPSEAIALQSQKVAFLFNQHMGIIELLEKKR